MIIKFSDIGDDVVTEREFACRTGKSLRTVKRWRQIGIGPAFIRIGGAVGYRGAAIRAWFESVETGGARQRRA